MKKFMAQLKKGDAIGEIFTNNKKNVNNGGDDPIFSDLKNQNLKELKK